MNDDSGVTRMFFWLSKTVDTLLLCRIGRFSRLIFFGGSLFCNTEARSKSVRSGLYFLSIPTVLYHFLFLFVCLKKIRWLEPRSNS